LYSKKPFDVSYIDLLFLYNYGGIIMKLFDFMTINNDRHLEINGCDAVDLAKKYGTPLYVIDSGLVKKNCRTYKSNFSHKKVKTDVIYASKAFLTIGMCKLIEAEGLSLDVVSGGELYTAMKANFPADRIYMHGNNKTVDELLMALNYGIHRIVVDNETEFERLNYLCAELDKKVDVLLRVNPGIEAHTHEFIQTAKNDSKFGISIFRDDICTLIDKFSQSYYVNLKGFHCHIGSQIQEETSFYQMISAMFDFVEKINRNCNFITDEINFGGGFGVYYSNEDVLMNVEDCLANMVDMIYTESKNRNIAIPRVMIEPGRAIVANAGTTLYKVGGLKDTFSEKHFIFTDGGMADNPRTALYDSIYEACIANNADGEPEDTFTVAGKCCESGDVLIKQIQLPTPKEGDILAIFSTGAYNYSMASNYNRLRKPAVVFVENGESKLAVKRETYEDIIRNDIWE